MLLRAGLVTTIVLLLATLAGAADLSVSFAFESQYKPGRWTPLRVTVSDKITRTANLSLYVPHSRTTALRIGQQLTVGPDERTFIFYAPLEYSIGTFRVELRDAATGKLIAQFPRPDDGDFWPNQPAAVEKLIVSCGESFRLPGPLTLRSANGANGQRAEQAAVANISPAELPAVPLGFEGVDILVLAGLTAQEMDAPQQKAVVDWVKAGGQLLYWPGDQPLDPGSPLAAALPGTFGAPRAVRLSDRQLFDASLPARFADLSIRPITPAPGAEMFPLFGSDQLSAIYGRVGLGRVMVLPINASTLQFQGTALPFWTGLCAVAFPLNVDPDHADNSYLYGQDARREAGLNGALDMIGQIPGTGSFGFGYVATMLGAMMFVVGPLDWFVLKKLGRQPWTWFTTAGWIGVITCAAVYAGHLLRSGDLHFRTLSVIDEIDGHAVSRADALLLYSPGSERYDIQTDAASWWEPFGTAGRYASDALPTAVETEQDYRGNRPLPMFVEVWNYRFLHGQAGEPGPPSLDAKLSRASDGTIIGTIRNTSGSECERPIYIRTRASVFRVDIALPTSGEAVNIDGKCVPVDPNDPVLKVAQDNDVYYNAQPAAAVQKQKEPPLAATPLALLGGLASDRAGLIDQLLRNDPDRTAAVYAMFIGATPPAKVADASAKVEHHQLVRAVVKLSN